MAKPVLYYVYDPMCSWCWGYRPVWLQLQQALEGVVEIRMLLGGLAEDSDLPMPNDLQVSLQNIWHKISTELGAQFNFDFWSHCQPKRSTYLSCRAIIFARKYQKEQAMCFAIQQAYYLNAKNPSEVKTLIQIAANLNLDEELFAQQVNSKTLKQQLTKEIKIARAMPIQGFPSLVLAINEKLIPIRLDYQYWQTSNAEIEQCIEQYTTAGKGRR